MPSRARSFFMRCCSTLFLLTLLGSPRAAAADPPAAHHPGAWTPAQYWPGTDTVGVQAVHMALARGDTLFGRPHSQVLAWGSWSPVFPEDGGLWGWNPTTDVGTAAVGNLGKLPLAPPPYWIFCAGHTSLPGLSTDILILGGQDRAIAGEDSSVRFVSQERRWGPVAGMASRRWYPVGTAIPWGNGDWRVLATAGLAYDHMAVFGGRRADTGTLTSNVERYQLADEGHWDTPATESGPNWPEARERHTLADQGKGPHYLFGGRVASGPLRDDIWQLIRNEMKYGDSTQTYAWTRLQPAAATQNAPWPSPRWRHVAAVDPGSDSSYFGPTRSTMYVFGGEDADSVRNDLWKVWWDPAPPTGWKWSLVAASGTPPPPRAGATAVWDDARGSRNGRLIVFGGESAPGVPIDNEVWILDSLGSSPRWRVAPRAADSDTPPTPRARHAMGGDAVRRSPPNHAGADTWFHAVVFGGRVAGAPDSLSGELWRLYVQPGIGSVIWKQRTPAGGPSPEARQGASAIVFDGYPGVATVFGGELAGGGTDASVWDIQLGAGNWSSRGTLDHALRGQAAIYEREPVTAMRPEVYDPATNTWTAWGASKFQFSYHMLFGAADGGLWYPGPNFWGEEKTWRLDPATGAWSQENVDGPGSAPAFDHCATGVLYRPDRILKVGDVDNTPYRFLSGNPASYIGRYRSLPSSASLDLREPTPQWRLPAADTMALARQFHNLTVVPTGEVVATGGMGLSVDDDRDPENDYPRRQPEIWDPEYVQGEARGYWYGARSPGEALATEPYARGHHSAALLLPDGRIVSGGGHDSDPRAQIRTVDIYSPPYLYRPLAQGGAPAFRPRLYGAQDHIAWGGTFEVACPDSVDAACLIRPGAATHTFNQDQRYVPLGIASQDSHRVVLDAPASAAVAPPGNYLLFVLRTDEVSGRLVPSIARWVNVGAAQTAYATYDTLPPAAVSNLQVQTFSGGNATLLWTAPADAGQGSTNRASRYELRYCAGSMATLEDFFAQGRRVTNPPVPATAGAPETFVVSGLSPDTAYYFRLISRDNAGSDRNWSGLSNESNSGGGGGCPFVDTQTAAGWQEENSILGRSLTGTLALDGYRLRHAPAPSEGRIHLRVRENELELTTLDQLRLIAIDHAPGLRSYALGDEVVLGSRVAAAHVSTQAGRDVTALLDGTGEGFLGRPGDTLYVDLGLHAAPAGAFGASSVNSEHTVIIDDGGGKGGGNPVLWREPERLSASAVDAQVLSTTGIRIETQDETGAWQLLAHRYPREHPDEAAYEPPGHGALRLVFVGEHRLRFLGRLERSGEPFTATKLPLLEAVHTRLGDVAAAIDTTGNLTTALAAGDTLALQFGWNEVPVGQERELLLLSRGVYTANLPARGEESSEAPAAFAFHGARPNPFAGTTALRFALPQAAHVRLEVLDAQGRRVALLANDRLAAGEHALTWDGRTAAGARANPGVYFYRFEAGAHRANGKLTHLP